MAGVRIFDRIKIPQVNKTTFDMTHHRKYSAAWGRLTPSMVLETLPNDYWSLRFEVMARGLALVAPVMDEIFIDVDTFFVPNRIQWSGWEEFIRDPSQTTYVHPHITGLDAVAVKDLGDYLGYTPNSATGGAVDNVKLNPFPLAAYCMIYDEWYRPQLIGPTQWQELEDGDNDTYYGTFLIGPTLPRMMEHDYFTSCLPTPGVGSAVKIPVFGETGQGTVTLDPTVDTPTVWRPQMLVGKVDDTTTSAGDVTVGASGQLLGTSSDAIIDPNGNYVIPNSELGTIPDLRRAIKLAEYLELLHRGGNRYREVMSNVYGSSVEDYRIDIPEFIARFSSRMTISEVLSHGQDTTTGNEYYLGQQAGHAISMSGSQRVGYHCKEHGWLITLTSIKPRPSYMQGLHKSMVRQDYYDYAIPHLQHIGDQRVTLQELYLDVDNAAKLDNTFGYQSRYADYKTVNNSVHGELRDSLKYWTLVQEFGATEPQLNVEFIGADKGEMFNRIFVDTNPNAHNFVLYQLNDCSVSRVLDAFSDPRI